MRAVFLIVLALAMATVWANEEFVIGAGGRVTAVKGEHAQIRMVREWVRMDIYSDYYDTAAQFVFHNDGPATSVTMGFPESGQDQDDFTRNSAFRSFQTSVDGKPVKAIRQLAKPGAGDDSYATYWVKTVDFAANQTRTVRVEYRSTPGEAAYGVAWVVYDFTGGNWKGTVDESMLTVVMHLRGTFAVQSFLPLARKGNTFSARWENWQAEDALVFRYIPTYDDALSLQGGPHSYGWNWYESTISVVSLGGSTGSAGPRWPAPAIIAADGKTACIALAALRDFLDPDASYYGPGHQGLAVLTWDAKTKTTTLSYEGKSVTVKLGSTTMNTPEGDDVALPVAPFLGEQVTVYTEPTRYLYVPVDAVVKALGGTATLNRDTRELHLAFPTVKQSAK